MSKKEFIQNIAITAIFLTIATIISITFFITTRNGANVAIFYMLATMLIARQTYGYVPGIVAAFVSVVCINFIFTFPYMELNFILDGYPLTFLGLIIIAVLTSALTTHLKKQNRMLIEAEKEKMRANLLRAVSHDLRTPLTGIIGTSTTYLEHEKTLSDAEKRAMVKGISEDADWLLHMVENLLSVTRIQGENASVATTLEPLEEVVADAVRRFRKRMPDCPLRVRVPEDFILAPMDTTLIEQVIINLLENAAYHANSVLPIDLTVSIANNAAQVSVKDYGQGIPDAQLSTLFDGYSFGTNQSSDSHKGMGIGLSICKTIINAHHGELCARNHENGAEFIFTLPIGEEDYES